MTKLASAHANMHVAWSAFVASCVAHGFADEFAAYRAEMRAPWPVALQETHDAYLVKQHAFYGLRDGPRGFLGGKGA